MVLGLVLAEGGAVNRDQYEEMQRLMRSNKPYDRDRGRAMRNADRRARLEERALNKLKAEAFDLLKPELQEAFIELARIKRGEISAD